MASANDRSVFDLVASGWSRTVTQLGGSGSLGVSIPAEFADDHDVDAGDDVVVRESPDGDRPVLEVHFE